MPPSTSTEPPHPHPVIPSPPPHIIEWKNTFHASLLKQVKRWCGKSTDFMSNLANISALITTHYQQHTPEDVLHYYATTTMRYLTQLPHSAHMVATTNIDLEENRYPTAVNWCGFYCYKMYVHGDGRDEREGANVDDERSHTPQPPHPRALFLGPFMGLPAVPIIHHAKGVCGATIQKTLRHLPHLHHQHSTDDPQHHHRYTPSLHPRELETMAVLVPDVHSFPGHIACDASSASELVVPLVLQSPPHPSINHCPILAILDLDSPYTGFFTQEDLQSFAKIVAIVVSTSSNAYGSVNASPVVLDDDYDWDNQVCGA